MPISILDLAVHRGAQKDENGGINGGEFEKVGLSIMGGCAGCGASLAAYNGYPSKSGYWFCSGCIEDGGWDDVETANKEIFGDDDEQIRD